MRVGGGDYHCGGLRQMPADFADDSARRDGDVVAGCVIEVAYDVGFVGYRQPHGDRRHSRHTRHEDRGRRPGRFAGRGNGHIYIAVHCAQQLHTAGISHQVTVHNAGVL